MTIEQSLQAYLDVLASENCRPADPFDALIAQGMRKADAALLDLLVPMAFAYERLTALGTEMPTTFVVREVGREDMRARLFDQPLFVAARRTAMRLAEGDVHAQRQLQQIAERSEAWATARELAGDNENFADVRLTEAVLPGVPPGHLHWPKTALLDASDVQGGPSAVGPEPLDRWDRALHWTLVIGAACVLILFPTSQHPSGRILLAHVQAVCVLAFACKQGIGWWRLHGSEGRSGIQAFFPLFFLCLVVLSAWLVIRAWLDPWAPLAKVRLPE